MAGNAVDDGGMRVWVERQLGSSVRTSRAVGGGCSHRAWRLELADGRCVFAKTNRASALPLLAAEAEGLRALACWAPPGLVVPEPLGLGESGEQAMLLLPWLDLAPAGTASGAMWRALGAALATLHHASARARPGTDPQPGYGYGSDNYIGGSGQSNGWMACWSRFFVERRLAVQLLLASAAGQPFRDGDALLERAAQLLEGHNCTPVLVHGDLWSGNAALLVAGGATLFDPAVYWADREVDLAMARLFGGFPETFFAGYEAEWPLPPDWLQRLELYNLYHLLNHANLFGGGYRKQAQASLDRLVA